MENGRNDLDQNDGELLKRIICIDEKTMRSNKRGEEKATHVVSAWSKEDGFCLGQKVVQEKSNEITAIPELLDKRPDHHDRCNGDADRHSRKN